MTYAAIFSGQGSQHAQMLPWVREGATLQAMCGLLGRRDWRVMLDDAAGFQNFAAQVLLIGSTLAAWEQLANELNPPEAVAGYSVGELAAFSAAGVYASEAALRLAASRARAMDRAAQGCSAGLLSITHASADTLQRVLDRAGLFEAIRQSPSSVIVGGPFDLLHEAARIATQSAAQATLLPINVASHTPLMAAAGQEFSRALEQEEFCLPQAIVFGHLGRRLISPDHFKDALVRQISSTVHWDDCMDAIAARQVSCVLEVGPGQALSRLWNRTYPHIPARSCDDFKSAAGVVAWVRSQQARR